ncbi:hypothetical protein [Rosettibacter firmus]|uniref:hypothetical protein n=1 Tax=Rosettibacter firmus TaxID=3111522 RepID=UPI00336BD99E
MITIRNILEKISSIINKYFFKKKSSFPLIIIKKENDDEIIKEYKSIEDVIIDLENDPNVSSEKIEILKISLKKLKNRTSIKIKDGEIIK